MLEKEIKQRDLATKVQLYLAYADLLEQLELNAHKVCADFPTAYADPVQTRVNRLADKAHPGKDAELEKMLNKVIPKFNACIQNNFSIKQIELVLNETKNPFVEEMRKNILD